MVIIIKLKLIIMVGGDNAYEENNEYNDNVKI